MLVFVPDCDVLGLELENLNDRAPGLRATKLGTGRLCPELGRMGMDKMSLIFTWILTNQIS